MFFQGRLFINYFYKSFVRTHLDYGDILYHQPYNGSINRNVLNWKVFNKMLPWLLLGP